jgi:hypothetical protein
MIDLFNCQYKTCECLAVSKGTVFTKNPINGGKDIPVEVYACEEHVKVNSFFENEKLGGITHD